MAAYAVILDEKLRVACVVDKLREVAEECARSLEVISPLDSAIQLFHAASGEAYELHAHFLPGSLRRPPRRSVTDGQSSRLWRHIAMSDKVLASLENSYGDYCVWNPTMESGAPACAR